jgi:exoribonuclease-2
MGVAQYTWATSPLRRYVDLVNQWQIIACARHGRTAALAAPFKPKDAALFSIISGFDAAYASLQRLPEHDRALLDAALAAAEPGDRARRSGAEGRPGARRHAAAGVPPARHRSTAARCAHVRARVAGIDLLKLELHAQLLARIDAASPPPDAPDEPEAEDESPDAGALRLAIELDAPAAGAAAPATSATSA